jgi:hypothetical protein
MISTFGWCRGKLMTAYFSRDSFLKEWRAYGRFQTYGGLISIAISLSVAYVLLPFAGRFSILIAEHVKDDVRLVFPGVCLAFAASIPLLAFVCCLGRLAGSRHLRCPLCGTSLASRTHANFAKRTGKCRGCGAVLFNISVKCRETDVR